MHPFFLSAPDSGESKTSHIPCLLARTEPLGPMALRLGRHQSQSHQSENSKIFVPARNQTPLPGQSGKGTVTALTELPWLKLD